MSTLSPRRVSPAVSRSVALALEPLESRNMLSAYGMLLGKPVPIPDWIPEARIPEIQQKMAKITRNGSTAPVYPADAEANAIIGWDSFIVDPQYNGANGHGYSIVIIDSGIDVDHPFFGPDNDGNGVADRIVYQEDFADNDLDASDATGHGTHVASIAAGFQDGVYAGVAPAADIIALKVFSDGGGGNFTDIEDALMWVIGNWQTYNIAAVNMSLGDRVLYDTPPTTDVRNIKEEVDMINDFGISVVASAGNDYHFQGSQQGLMYPAAADNVIAVGATWDTEKLTSTIWPDRFGNPGAIDNTADVDRIASFSQRHVSMLDVLAPGALINGARNGGGMEERGGTSMSAPHVAGTAVLARQLWDLHRATPTTPFEPAEFKALLRTTGPLILDGDDEDDNVINTNLSWRRLDVAALTDEIVYPRVSEVVVRSTLPDAPGVFPEYSIPSGSGQQLASVPVAKPTQVIVEFTEPVGTMQGSSVQLGNLQIDNLFLAEDRGFGAEIGLYMVTEENPKRFIWTLAAPLSDRVQVGMMLSDVIVDGAGNALDGNWKMPASLDDQSVGISAFPSGDKLLGGDFTFGFTYLPGDANGDNVIDVADLNAVRNNFDSGTTWEQGDFDGDNDVDIVELNLVRNSFGFDDYLTWPTGAPFTGGGGGTMASATTGESGGSLVVAPLTSGSTNSQVGEQVLRQTLRDLFAARGYASLTAASLDDALFGWDTLGDEDWWKETLSGGAA